MNLLLDYPAIALVPPFVVIGLALWTRHILFSLSMGIITGGIILKNSLAPWVLFRYIQQVLVGAVYDLETHMIKWDHTNLLLFLWVLGVLVYMLENSGHLEDFSDFIAAKFSTPREGQFFIFLMGLLVFIDDYFKILAVGSVTQTLCHRVGISRAKLAYLLDTMAAPLCMITPISSWGAVVMTTMTTIIFSQQIAGYTGISLYLATIAYNFYALFSLLLALATIFFQSNFGYMQKLEDKALLAKKRSNQKSEGKNPYTFLFPIFSLISLTLLTMIFTGSQATTKSTMGWISFIGRINMEFSLLIGGIGAVITSYLFASNRPNIIYAAKKGWQIMFDSLAILLLAWAFVPIITDTKLGVYLAGAVLKNSHLPVPLLPIPIFIITAAIAFSTGSSWGAFAILLPISSKLAMDSDTQLLVPLLASCLGGAIFGDHASPISDTSILASTGASCNHMEHIKSQLPYTFWAGIITIISYMILGFTYSLSLSLLTGALLIFLTAYFLKRHHPKA